MVDQGKIEHLNTWYFQNLQHKYGKAEIHIDEAPPTEQNTYTVEMWVEYNGKGYPLWHGYNMPTLGKAMQVISKWFKWHGIRQKC